MIVFLFISLSLPQVFSLEVKKAAPKNQVYGGFTIKEDSTLKKLLNLPEVSAQYKSCQTKITDPKELDKIPDCLWNGDGDKIPPLNPKAKENIKKLYAAEESEALKNKGAVSAKEAEIDVTAKNNGENSNLTNRTLNISTDYKSDPAVKALSAFFGKKLDEVLNGSEQDIKDKKIVTVDHKKFINLYTSELGKSIVNSFTSYCMESKPDCRNSKEKDKEGKNLYSGDPCLISSNESTRQADIKSNLQTINAANFTEDEGAAWTHCISTVSSVCYDNNKTDKDSVYSKQRACLVMDFVKSARKNLIIADQQKAFYDGIKGGGDRGIASIATNMKVIDNEKNLSADKITQITSGDIDKDFKDSENKNENISKTNSKVDKEADECVDNTAKSKCSQFLDANKTQNTEAVAEFGLRQFAKEDDLNEKLEDKKNVSSYLKEEGYTDQQIKDLTSGQNLEAVKDKIKERYSAEKKAIIAEMSSRIAKKTTVADGNITKSDSPTIGKIKDGLSGRNDDLKNLIHFNNIVASYLTISEANGPSKNVTRNTASLYAEVKSMDKKDSKDISDRLNKNKDLKETQTTADFQVGDINQILKYTEDQKKPTEK